MLGLLGMQLFMGVLTQRCVKQFDPNTAGQPWHDFIQDTKNWWKSPNDNSGYLCGNASTA